jgi:hypothetical protein
MMRFREPIVERRMSVRRCAAVLLLVGGAAVAVPAGAQPVVRVESSTGGEIALTARRAPIPQVLQAIASRAGFEVLIEKAAKRPLVTLTVPMAPVAQVLRQTLRGRNYALMYDADTAAVSHVILLAPSAPSGPARPSRATPRKQRRGTPPSPLVIRN